MHTDKETLGNTAKPRPPLTPVEAQTPFIVNIFTAQHLKDREFEEGKPRHLLFHFDLLEKM